MSRDCPNIIYIVCHDLGKHLNCYGAGQDTRRVTSPNLDRFAREGVLFTNYFASSVCCSASRGCAMTGLYAHTNGLMGLVNRRSDLDAGQLLIDLSFDRRPFLV